MAKIDIWNIGAIGVVSDVPDFGTPPEAWTRLENVRATDRGLESILGEDGQAFGIAGASTCEVGSPWAGDGYDPTEATWRRIRFINGVFYAFGGLGDTFHRSTDNGATWTVINIPDPNVGFPAEYDISFDGVSTLVVVGRFGFHSVSTDNGVTWTDVIQKSPFDDFFVVLYANSLWVSAGQLGTLFTSPASTTWTTRTSTFGTSDILGIAYGNSVWVIVGEAGKAATSTDGLSWTSRTSSFGATNITDVAFGAGLFVAVGATKIATSTDGINWTQVIGHPFEQVEYVTYADGCWALVGWSEVGESLDGLTWTIATPVPDANTAGGIAYGNGYFVAGINGTADDLAGRVAVPAVLTAGGQQGSPHWIWSSPTSITPYWAYAEFDKVFAYTGRSHSEITQTGEVYRASLDSPWTGVWLNGVLILNNGVNTPQAWIPISSGKRLIDLPNWISGATARVIRQYKNFLVALDYDDGFTAFPTRVKWSHPADPGEVPESWDDSDPTKLTGSISLSETPGFVVDGMALRDGFAIYKEDATIQMQFVGGQSIHRFDTLSNISGIMSTDCVAEFKPGLHAIFNLDGELVVNNGQSVEEMTPGRVSKYIRNTINTANQGRSFVISVPEQQEVWACYPTGSDTYCTEALVWNWDENTFTTRDLTATVSMDRGPYAVITSGTEWDLETDTWDNKLGVWGDRRFSPAAPSILAAHPTISTISEMLVGNDFQTDGTAYAVVMERIGLTIVGTSRSGEIKTDPNKVKLVTRFWPYIEASASINFNIEIGTQEAPNEAVVWQPALVFNTTSDLYVEPLIQGKYIAIRITVDTTDSWVFRGYGLEIELVGDFL